ncbi:MAG: Tol-Pal system beta propeller repeat protein TolB [Rhizomicrobium sp.]
MRKLLLSLVLALAAMMPRPALAALAVDITQGNFQPLPIAIPDFSTTGAAGTVGADIAGVVRADLERSGLFRPIDPKAYVDHTGNINTVPNFANWRTINAQGLTVGSVTALPDGQLQVEFRLWDVSAQTQIWGQKFSTIPANWRRIAHMISDAIYEHVTGEKGYFDTRIVFISETGTALKRVKRLAIMDQDGANPIFLTNGSYMVLTPRFNPTAQMIAYMSYIGTKPRVYLFDIEKGQQEVLGNFPNMTFSPRFSPDGNRVVLTLETGGNSDIYMMDLRNRAVQRLTSDPAIDTAPSFSPDGRQIVFESDRGGGQQIYVMNVDGSNQRRISFGQGANGTPVWSPRGDLIAFTRRVGNLFNIGVMRPDGSGERLISSGGKDEGPTWAPNGRVLMYSRTLSGGQGSQVWSVDVTGRNERRVLTPGSASDPAWSPLIQ